MQQNPFEKFRKSKKAYGIAPQAYNHNSKISIYLKSNKNTHLYAESENLINLVTFRSLSACFK